MRDIERLVPHSRSTLHKYTSDILFVQNGDSKNSATIEQYNKRTRLREAKLFKQEKAAEDLLPDITNQELFYLGLGIYIGEGTKTHHQTRITNSDPTVLLICKTWLIKCLNVPEDNIRIALHIYPDVSERASIDYWSNTLNISQSQFYKCTTDLRNKSKTGRNNRVLQYGTAQMYVTANGNKNFGSRLHDVIMSYIDRSKYLAGMVQW